MQRTIFQRTTYEHMNPAPQPTIINEKEEYKVEEVRKHRKQNVLQT